MKSMDLQFEVKPPSGSSPRQEDTPRTKNLKELRLKRLQYFDNKTNISPSSANVESNTSNGVDRNQRDVNQNVAGEVNVLSSMTRDPRVTAPGPESTTLQNQRPRSSSVGNSLHDARPLYRNNLTTSDSLQELNNNEKLKGKEEGLGGRGFLLSENHQNHSKYSTTHSSSQSLGFSLPSLSPRDTSIVNQREAPTFSPRNIVSKKGKGVKGKKFKNSVKNSLEETKKRQSTEDLIGVTGQSLTLTNSKEMNHQGGRKSVIEAEFEDDYSQLGLSMDRVGYERQSERYSGPSPSRKVKAREKKPSSQSTSLKGSKSTENFQELKSNIFSAEDSNTLHVKDSEDLFMKRSQTHEGFSNLYTGGMERPGWKSEVALNNVDLFQDTDGSSLFSNVPQQNQFSQHKEGHPPFSKTDVAQFHGVDKKPVVMESTDFTKSGHKIPGKELDDENMNPSQSVIRQEFQTDTLKSILGEDRMERLLRNLEASAWIEEESKSVVGSARRTSHQDTSFEPPGSETTASHNNIPFVEKSCDINERGLSTHRPADQNDLSPVDTTKPKYNTADSVTSNTKCSYTSADIYQRARTFSGGHSNDEDRYISAFSQSIQRQQIPVKKDSYLKSEDNASHVESGSSRLDHIRGIRGIKKEFYKTVAITDSTAVSDASLNTAKHSSRQSVDSPRGQIPKPNPNNTAHQRSLSLSGAWPSGCTKEEHIEGIRQHVADIRTQKFEDQIRAGMPYTTSSIERYFASMEHLNSEVDNGFEPVPEPEIVETPRKEVKSGTGPSSSGVKNSSRNEITGSNKKLFSEQNQKGNSSKEDLVVIGGKKKVLNESTREDSKAKQSEMWKNFKIDNDKKKILKEMFDEDGSDDDDLFTKVTSMVDDMDGATTNRLKKLGIDFEFLKKQTQTQIKNNSQSQDVDVTSVNITDDSDSDLEDSKPVDHSTKVNAKLQNASPKNDVKVEKAQDAEDEVEFLFRMSPRNISSQDRYASSNELLPEKSGEPSLSTSLKLNLNQSSVDLEESSAGTSQVKVCPECAEVNKTYVTWCVECGAVLSGVDPVPCKAKRETSRHLSLSTSTSLSQSATNFKNRLEESMNNPPHPQSTASGSGWLQSPQHSKGRPVLAIDTKEVMQLKKEEAVRESDEFVYEKVESPVRALPKALQSQLSLDLAKPEPAPLRRGDKKSQGEQDKLAEISEGINFEYKQHESPKKSLPAALQEELNLNLSLDGSQTTASFQAGKMEGKKSLNYKNQVRESIEDEAGPRAGPSGLLKLQNNREDTDDDDDVPIHLDDTEEGKERIVYNQFIERLKTDPRFKTPEKDVRPKSAIGPTRSAGRPKSAMAQRNRPKSANVTSKVRASIEKEGYQRKWGRSSTTAWSEMSHGEVRSRSSVHASQEGDGLWTRPSSAASRPTSALRQSGVRKTIGASGDIKLKSTNRRPNLTPTRERKPAFKSMSIRTVMVGDENDQEQEEVPVTRSVVRQSTSGPFVKPHAKIMMNTYAKYFEMSPRIASGEFSQWLCLPDEIWLHIMYYLSQADLARCAQVCMQLNRVALDESLWRSIVVKKKKCFTDEWLLEIGQRQPSSLSLVQCHGENVTANGVRELFRRCSDSLKALTFTGCSRGELTGDSILLHAASRCRHISHLDSSWSNVNDNGVLALVEASDSLVSVCLNGCQVITDEAIHCLVEKHGKSLKTLELFGCFNVTPRSAGSIATFCKSLTILNLGQCWKLSDASIVKLAPNLTQVENLDLRGVKQMKDQTVHQLMHHCKRLQSLSLANCPNLTDVSLTGIATYSAQIESLDLCGCKGISDMGVRALAMACHNMEYLDISSTAATHKSVSSLASYCHSNLEVVKLNFCKHITIPSLVRLAKNCKKLRKVYLYGATALRHIDEVRRVNSNLWIEM